MKSIFCILFFIFNLKNAYGDGYSNKIEENVKMLEPSFDKLENGRDVVEISDSEIDLYEILKGEIDFDDISDLLNRENQSKVSNKKEENVEPINLASTPSQIHNFESITKSPEDKSEIPDVEDHTASIPPVASSGNAHNATSPPLDVFLKNLEKLQDPDLKDYQFILSWYVYQVFDCALNNINSTDVFNLTS